jgi:beta-glucosidase
MRLTLIVPQPLALRPKVKKRIIHAMKSATQLTADQIQQRIAQLTLPEKAAMLAGESTWRTVAVPRLGIPALKMSDGPNGVRGESFKGGVTAAVFPVGIVLAQTWNLDLIERVGVALAQEAMTKGAQVILAPTVNIHRSPLGGRNFESFSEDPYLTARLAVAYIRGVQSQGIAATVKHYIANEQETERYRISSEVDERTLREIYLPPFEAAVREAQVWAMMASYNLFNGIPVSEHPYLLTDIPRGEWGWDGLIVSDWVFSVKSTAASVNAGLDLEMPGPGIWRGAKLLAAVQSGAVAERKLDESISRLLILLGRVGKFDEPDETPEHAVDRPEHRALIRQAAAEGMVLLKNERNILPLQRETLKKIAIIGPNAKTARIMGGGSSEVNAHYRVAPFDGVVSKLNADTVIGYEEGCLIAKLCPLLAANQFLSGKQGAAPGLKVEFFNADHPQGEPVVITAADSTEVVWVGTLPQGVDADRFSVRVSGRFVPSQTGLYRFGLTSTGNSRLSLDGQTIIDNWAHWTAGTQGNYFGMGSDEVIRAVELAAGREVLLEIDYRNIEGHNFHALRLGLLEPQPADRMERAVALAAQADVTLIFAGMSGEWDAEGFDRPDLELPGEQNELIRRAAAVNPNIVVILNTGSAVRMPWLDQVAAVLQAGYPGQEAGNAIADLLFGDVNPSGKLTQTYPARLEDTPSYLNFPGENGKVLYGERMFVGYRYYDAKDIAPLFPFGFGLSYTTFAYENLRLSQTAVRPGETLQVAIDILNTGSRPGQEVVQVYVRDPEARLIRPAKELKAFAKVALEPGERQTVTLELDQRSLAYFDDAAHQWVAEAGTFEVLVGASSRDIRAAAAFEWLETQRWL